MTARIRFRLVSARSNEAFIADDYRAVDELTSVFAFLNSLDVNTSVPAAGITALTTAQSINGTGPEGAGRNQ